MGKYVVVCDITGVATCYEVSDGHVVWKNRLSGKYSASPIAAGGLAYFLNEAGKTIVLRPGEEFETVAENALSGGKNEIFRSSLTPCDGQIFIRTVENLYCIGKL